jgi:hypothetical protein
MNAAGNRMVDMRAGYYDAINAMQTGTYKGSGDILDWTLWDRFEVDGTTPTLIHRLFVNGLGSPGGVAGNRNLADTNLVGNQGIPLGQKLYVRAIKVFYRADEVRTPAELVAWHDLLANTTINFTIPGKDTYGQWALDEVLGIPVSMMNVPAATNYNPSESAGKYVGILPLNLPITLSSQVAFNVVVEHHVAPAAGLDDDLIKIGLNGILERLS